ncbi:uncharacterized protein [Ptychodera flava]|uniref:uncharacterized protein n=1 Tax=Ptychodera flava TaxID=63121 RepID=UPI00396A5EFA
MTDSLIGYSGNSRFYVKKENVDKFDPTDVTGKKIVFYDGWHSKPRCLKKHNVVGTDSITFRPIILRRRDVPYFLEKNEVDAVFALEFPVQDDKGGHLEIVGGTPAGFVPVGDTMYCTPDGAGLAARKDNDVTKWFNETLRRMKRNGKFAALCKESEMRHGKMGPIGCKY